MGVFRVHDGTLSDLYIHPNYVRCGYGTACVRFALAQSEDLRLTVLSTNDGAIGLYWKMGFRFTGRDIPLGDTLREREMIYMEKHNG